MNSAVRDKLRIWLIKAGWAPIAVVVLHAAGHIFTDAGIIFDYVSHFFGGLAMAYFFTAGFSVWNDFIGAPHPFVRRVFVFALTATVALFWEFGEFSFGAAIGYYIQYTITETMFDLMLGCAGAGAFLIGDLF